MSKRARVDPDIRKAETLPPEAFTDPAFLERELATIFSGDWLMVPEPSGPDSRRPLADQLKTRGSRVPVSVLDRPLFLQRDWKGTLRCFPNVCTHAWHTLVSGAERQRTITCPQHGRQFDLEGRYVSQPGFEKCGGFPRPCDNLAGFPVLEWGRFLFISLGKAGPSPLDPVTESLGSLPLAEFKRRPSPDEMRIVDGNWKQHAWNYMDRLHLPYIHKRPGGLSDAVDMATYTTELFPKSSLQWACAADPKAGFAPGTLHPRFGTRPVFALWWFVFPNLTLNFYPWGLSINLYMPVPGQPQQTAFHWHHHVLDAKKYAKRDEVWMNRQADDEDVEAMVQVGRGVRSGLAPRGRFGAEVEKGPHWFHRLVDEATASP